MKGGIITGTTTVGTIGLNMVLNSAGFRRSLQNVQSQANTANQKIAASFKKMGAVITAAFSAKVISSFGKSCIDLGSDLAEVQNVVDVTFTSMSNSVNKWSKDAAKSYGLSETMAKKYVGTFGSMAEAFGFTEQQSYDMATALTGLTGDVASFYNIEQDLAYTKLKSVFSGETETLKDLGIVMTQSALDNYALANGYGKTVKQMTEAEKVTLRYNFVLGQLNNATGDFARTQDGWANQTRVLQLRFDSLKATIGQGLINAFTPVIKVVNSLINRLSTVAEKFKALTQQIFGNAGGSSSGSPVENLAVEANSGSSALENVADSAEKAKRSLAGFDKLNVLSDNKANSTNANNSNAENGTNVVNGTKSPLASAMDGVTKSWNAKSQKLINSVKSTMDKIKTAIASVGDSWKKIWNNGTGRKFLDNIRSLLGHIIDNVGSVADAFKRAWDTAGRGDAIVQSFLDKWNSIVSLVDTISVSFNKIWNNGTGERIWGNILEIITNCNNATKTLRDKIKDAWDNNGAGEKIWGAILGIVEDITGFLNDMSQIRLDWLENLNLSPITEAVANLGGAFRKLLEACGDKLKTAYKKILLPLAKWTIEKAVPKLVETFAKALKAVSDVVKKISDKTLYAIAGGIAAVGTAVIVFKAGTAIAAGITKVKNAMKLLITTISAHPLLAIAGAITGIVTSVIAYNELKWSNSEAKKFADEIATIKTQLEETTQGIEDSLSGTFERLDEIYADNTLIDNYQKKLEELLSKAELSPSEQAQLQTIVTYFSDNVKGFEDVWDKYVFKSDDGTYKLKTDLKTVQDEITKTIEDYQRLANMSALSDLQTTNTKDKISANRDLGAAKQRMEEMEQKTDDKYWEFKKLLDESMSPDQVTITLERLESSDQDVITNAEWGEAYNTYRANKKELEKLKETYNGCVAKVNKLTMVSDDLLDVQKVLNGDYSDAVAVMMAYSNQMISMEDIQKSQWKSLENLEKAAKDSGKNTVLGLVEGTEAYKSALKKSSNGLATLVLSEYDAPMEINSPSRAMKRRGVWTVEGLVNGISVGTKLLTVPIQNMMAKIQGAIEPIKNVFSNAFSGIWGAIQTPMNFVLGKVEDFVNTFNSGLSRVGGKILNGVDVAANIVANVAKPNMKLPHLAKGGIVKAPTLAVVGDNAGANSGNPEVISPLNKLQTMINSSNGEDVVILKQMLDYLKRIYEMFVIFRNNGGNHYEFVAKINGSEIFDEIVKQNELYKKRHGGKSAFA